MVNQGSQESKNPHQTMKGGPWPLRYFVKSFCATQSMVPAASPGLLVRMQTLRQHPRPPEPASEVCQKSQVIYRHVKV